MCQKHDRKGVPGRRRRCRPPFLPLARSAKNLLLPLPLRPSFSSDRRYWAKRGLSYPFTPILFLYFSLTPSTFSFPIKWGGKAEEEEEEDPLCIIRTPPKTAAKREKGFLAPPLVLKCCDNAHPFLLPYSPNDPTSFAMAGRALEGHRRTLFQNTKLLLSSFPPYIGLTSAWSCWPSRPPSWR